MRFSLYYRGPLASNGRPEQKQQIREAFHPQIRALFNQAPLNHLSRTFLAEHSSENPLSLRFDVRGNPFACLVSDRIKVVAELSVMLLRPDPPGKLLAAGGDLDNRLKTLMDALTLPTASNQLPPNYAPTGDQQPLFCLLEDDSLVTRLSIETRQWLDPQAASRSEAVVIVDVRTRTTVKMMKTSDFD